MDEPRHGGELVGLDFRFKVRGAAITPHPSRRNHHAAAITPQPSRRIHHAAAITPQPCRGGAVNDRALQAASRTSD